MSNLRTLIPRLEDFLLFKKSFIILQFTFKSVAILN